MTPHKKKNTYRDNALLSVQTHMTTNHTLLI